MAGYPADFIIRAISNVLNVFQTSPAAQKPAAKKAKIATAAAGSGNKQANIMSFFKKK